MPIKDPIARAAYAKAYREKNRDKMAKFRRDWLTARPNFERDRSRKRREDSEYKLYQQAYRRNNKERIATTSAARKAANPELHKQRKREEYEKYKEAYLNRARNHWAKFRDEYNAYRKTPEFREQKNASRKTWWSSLPLWERKFYSGVSQVYGRKHASFGKDHLNTIKQFYKQAFSTETVGCAYCEKVVYPVNACVDHKQPYRFGGKHEASNLAVVCVDCNLLKGATPWEVWSAYLEKKRGSKWQ
jgi:hypothetical protein